MDTNKVQKIFNSTAVRDIEIEILSTQHEIEKRCYSWEAGEEIIKHLLGTRKTLLNHQFVMDEQGKQLLSDFNEALKTQMIEMRQKAITLFDSTMASGVHASFDLKAKCFLGYEYSRLHPVQTSQNFHLHSSVTRNSRLNRRWLQMLTVTEMLHLPTSQDSSSIFQRR